MFIWSGCISLVVYYSVDWTQCMHLIYLPLLKSGQGAPCIGAAVQSQVLLRVDRGAHLVVTWYLLLTHKGVYTLSVIQLYILNGRDIASQSSFISLPYIFSLLDILLNKLDKLGERQGSSIQLATHRKGNFIHAVSLSAGNPKHVDCR